MVNAKEHNEKPKLKELGEKPKQNSIAKPKGIVSAVFIIIFLAATLISFIFLPVLFSLSLFILFLFPMLVYLSLGRLTRKWGWSVLFAILIQLLLLLIIGIWVCMDTSQLVNNIQSQPRYLLYSEDNAFLFGYALTSDSLDMGSMQNGKMPFKQLTDDEVKIISESLNRKDKFVLIIKKEFFGKAPEVIETDMEGQKISIPKATALEALKSENPDDVILNYLVASNAEGLNLPKEFTLLLKQDAVPNEIKIELKKQAGIDKETARVIVLGLMLMKTIEANGVEYVFESFSNNNLKLKPNYIVFWVAKNIPIKQVKPYLPEDVQKDMNSFKMD